MRKSQSNSKYITGSRFAGSFNSATHCMEGFGRYTFPDGSEYLGYFKKGKFHGFGRFSLSEPYHFTFVGEYEDGKLVSVQDMIYGDGVRLRATFEGQKLNFDKWLYCTPTDRRFGSEIVVGVEPVGQEGELSSLPPLRRLADGTYDCGEGIFKPTGRCIVEIPPPFYRFRFVGCDKEVEWIMQHCRKGLSGAGVTSGRRSIGLESSTTFDEHIMKMNIHAMKEVHTCSCNRPSDRKAYLAKLCEQRQSKSIAEESTSTGDDSISDICKTPTSLSTSSFTDQTHIISDLEDKCALEVHLLKPMTSDADMERNSFLIEKFSKASNQSGPRLTQFSL